MGITKELAGYVANLSINDLPDRVVRMTKLAILDTMGVIFAGSREYSSKVMIDFARDAEGKAESTIIGQGFKTLAAYAALANGAMGHALDYDDTTTSLLDPTKGGLHAGSPIVSAAMAISEMEESNGKDLIAAVAGAYDIASRLEISVPPQDKSLQSSALHPSGIFGTFAATAAAAKLLGFNEEQITNAFGVAGSQTSGILQGLTEGSPMKRIQSGFAARNGVLSAILTQRGLDGPKQVFEGRFGFFNAYYNGNYSPDKVTYELGREFAVSYDSFKLYPTCALAHSSIDAALNLVNTYDIKPEDVTTVNVWLSRYEYIYCCEPAERKYRPVTVIDAEFNIPFAVAAGIVKRRVTLDEISERGIQDREILEFAKKIKTFIDPALVNMNCVLEIELANGDKVRKQIDIPKGWPKSSLQWNDGDVIDKFRVCLKSVGKSKRTEEIIDLIMNLERLDNVTSLSDAIRE